MDHFDPGLQLPHMIAGAKIEITVGLIGTDEPELQPPGKRLGKGYSTAYAAGAQGDAAKRGKLKDVKIASEQCKSRNQSLSTIS